MASGLTEVATTDECSRSMLSAPLGDEEAVDLARWFSALGDPARLRLLSLIATEPRGEACVCELVAPLRRSQPTFSHHLKILYDVGLVERERRGVWVWYRVLPERLAVLRAALDFPGSG